MDLKVLWPAFKGQKYMHDLTFRCVYTFNVLLCIKYRPFQMDKAEQGFLLQMILTNIMLKEEK